MKNGPGDPKWGWKMLMQDLNSEHPVQPQQPSGIVSNIVNYPPTQGVPMQLKRFNFASIYAVIIAVILLTIAGVLLWRFGVFDYLIETCRSLLI